MSRSFGLKDKMIRTHSIAPVRVLPDEVANKIAAGEVVERPASVVKELVENALDAGATRIAVRMAAAGRSLIEVQDNGHGMSEQNALLAIERHATSKIRSAQDLDNIQSLGFRGEALASIAAVSRFTLVTRRAEDEGATQLQVDGGILREVRQVGAPEGTRITVKRLYFNTPVRAKFLKGIATEIGHSIDIVQRHALSNPGVGFQFIHNDRCLLDVPERASLRDRIALIWGLSFVREMVDIAGERDGFRLSGLAGSPELNRSGRSHQFFFVNRRPVVSRSLQYGLADAYRGLLTVGRYPVAVLSLEMNPRQVDVNIHPTKREIRFRDERAAHDAVRDVVRACLAEHRGRQEAPPPFEVAASALECASVPESAAVPTPPPVLDRAPEIKNLVVPAPPSVPAAGSMPSEAPVRVQPAPPRQEAPKTAHQDLPGLERYAAPVARPDAEEQEKLTPSGCFERVNDLKDAPLQVFDSYLLVEDGPRLLIIDQHALHERLNFEMLVEELADRDYSSQQLAVPVVFEAAPSQVRLLESNLHLFSELGIEIEAFGGNAFQVVSVCHLYNESKAPDVVYGVLDELSQGNLFDKENARTDLLRIASRACKASVKAGDRLTQEERRGLLAGFRRLQPPYTCPHGRPIIVELTQRQMEKSFRRTS